jgi:hypothetical protein
MASIEAEYGKNKDGLQRHLYSRLGPLYHINWFRIILDEAHQIKNMAAQSTLPTPLYHGPVPQLIIR